MAALQTHVVPLAGTQLDAALVAAASGDDCQTGGGVFLAVKNGDAASHTVTLPVFPAFVDGDLPVPARTVSVAAGKTQLIPLTDRYRDPATGRCAVTYDGVTSVSHAVIRIGE